VAAVAIQEFNAQPLSPYDIGPIYPIDQNGIVTIAQQMDSQVPGTTSPEGRLWAFGPVGRSTIRQTNTIYVTPCHLMPDSVAWEQGVFVVSCLPAWVHDEYGGIPRFPVDGGIPIRVVYPPTLEVPVANATNAWNSKLAQWGLEGLHFERDPGGLCEVWDAYCIVIDSKLNPENPTACGWIASGIPGSDHIYTTRSFLYPKPGYDSWSAPFKTGTISHELGHLLGQGHRLNCPAPNSVMNTPLACNIQGLIPTTPTDSDALSTVKTPYLNGSEKTCG
jgi:hypothetical protein